MDLLRKMPSIFGGVCLKREKGQGGFKSGDKIQHTPLVGSSLPISSCPPCPAPLPFPPQKPPFLPLSSPIRPTSCTNHQRTSKDKHYVIKYQLLFRSQELASHQRHQNLRETSLNCMCTLLLHTYQNGHFIYLYTAIIHVQVALHRFLS